MGEAADLAPIIAEIRAGGVVSLHCIAGELNRRGNPGGKGQCVVGGSGWADPPVGGMAHVQPMPPPRLRFWFVTVILAVATCFFLAMSREWF